jgi:hypothetical protein
MRRSISWIKLDDEAAHRALLPTLTHLMIDNTLKRLDDLGHADLVTFVRQLVDRYEWLIDQAKPVR